MNNPFTRVLVQINSICYSFEINWVLYVVYVTKPLNLFWRSDDILVLYNSFFPLKLFSFIENNFFEKLNLEKVLTWAN